MLSLSFLLIWVNPKKYKSVSGFARNRRAVNRRGWTVLLLRQQRGRLPAAPHPASLSADFRCSHRCVGVLACISLMAYDVE